MNPASRAAAAKSHDCSGAEPRPTKLLSPAASTACESRDSAIDPFVHLARKRGIVSPRSVRRCITRLGRTKTRLPRGIHSRRSGSQDSAAELAARSASRTMPATSGYLTPGLLTTDTRAGPLVDLSSGPTSRLSFKCVCSEVQFGSPLHDAVVA